MFVLAVNLVSRKTQKEADKRKHIVLHLMTGRDDACARINNKKKKMHNIKVQKSARFERALFNGILLVHVAKC